MLTGPGGVGKSLFEQMLFTAIALGKPFLGMETEQRNTLYVTCEDDADELWRRQYAINDALGITCSDLAEKLSLCSLSGELDTALAIEGEGGTLETTPRWQALREACKEHSIGLYAFDNATDALAADHNALHPVAAFVNMLTGLAIEMDGAAMILHHPNKAGDDWLGSVGWHNKVRSRWTIEFADQNADPDGRRIKNPKANYGPSGGSIDFRWHQGAFVRDEDLPADYAEQLSQSIRLQGENEAFLRCLRARNEVPGREVGPSIGPNYAPARFAEMTEAKGLSKKALARAMERLFHLGRIETKQIPRKGSDMKTIIVQAVPNPSEPASEPLPNTVSEPLRTPIRTLPNTHPIDKSISGAASGAAAPIEENSCAACGGSGCWACR